MGQQCCVLDCAKGRPVHLMAGKAMQRGFTLIELMTAIAVLAVLLVLGLPSFMETIQNMQVRTAAESILDGLQVARAEAVRRNGFTQFTLGPGTGWTVTQITPPSPSSGLACSVVATIQSRSGSEGSQNATVSVFPAGATAITFTPTGFVALQTAGEECAANPLAQINVGSSVLSANQERPLEIRITASGGIRLCVPTEDDMSGKELNPPANRSNWKLPAGDPRRCG